MNKEEIKLNLSATDNWIRGLFVLLFVVVFNVASTVIFLIVVFQFITLLITGKNNDVVAGFARNLNAYVHEILEFATFNTEEKPFPFKPFPNIKTQDDEVEPEKTATSLEPTTSKKETVDDDEITPV